MRPTDLGYPRVDLCTRPPRLALTYMSEPGWISMARGAVASVSRLWGGMSACILPPTEGKASESLLPILRHFDPDHVAIDVPSLDELADADLSVREKAIRMNQLEGEPDSQTLGSQL